jgi:hypothetical protein
MDGYIDMQEFFIICAIVVISIAVFIVAWKWMLCALLIAFVIAFIMTRIKSNLFTEILSGDSGNESFAFFAYYMYLVPSVLAYLAYPNNQSGKYLFLVPAINAMIAAWGVIVEVFIFFLNKPLPRNALYATLPLVFFPSLVERLVPVCRGITIAVNDLLSPFFPHPAAPLIPLDSHEPIDVVALTKALNAPLNNALPIQTEFRTQQLQTLSRSVNGQIQDLAVEHKEKHLEFKTLMQKLELQSLTDTRTEAILRLREPEIDQLHASTHLLEKVEAREQLRLFITELDARIALLKKDLRYE